MIINSIGNNINNKAFTDIRLIAGKGLLTVIWPTDPF